MALTYSTQQALKSLLLAVGRGESGLESRRQSLCSIPDFSPSSGFQRLDRDALGRIRGIDILNFLRDRSNYSAQLHECDQLVRFFDSNCDGALSQAEFQQILLPCENNYLKDQALARYPWRVGRFDSLACDIEAALQSVIEAELALQRETDSLKRSLQLGYDYSALSTFDEIDRPRRGRIDQISLGGFLRAAGAYPPESDVVSAIRRIDLDGDSALSLSEWQTFMGPAPTPVAAPVVVASPRCRSASPVRRSPLRGDSPVKAEEPKSAEKAVPVYVPSYVPRYYDPLDPLYRPTDRYWSTALGRYVYYDDYYNYPYYSRYGYPYYSRYGYPYYSRYYASYPYYRYLV